MFGEIEYDTSKQYTSVPMEEQLNALQKAIDNGKVCCISKFTSFVIWVYLFP